MGKKQAEDTSGKKKKEVKVKVVKLPRPPRPPKKPRVRSKTRMPQAYEVKDAQGRVVLDGKKFKTLRLARRACQRSKLVMGNPGAFRIYNTRFAVETGAYLYETRTKEKGIPFIPFPEKPKMLPVPSDFGEARGNAG